MSDTGSPCSTRLLREEIRFRSELWRDNMNSAELEEMDPTLALVFRDALELEGASRHDLRAWLKDFKEQTSGDKEVLSRDGLRHLANSVWRFSYEAEMKSVKAKVQGANPQTFNVASSTDGDLVCVCGQCPSKTRCEALQSDVDGSSGVGYPHSSADNHPLGTSTSNAMHSDYPQDSGINDRSMDVQTADYECDQEGSEASQHHGNGFGTYVADDAEYEVISATDAEPEPTAPPAAQAASSREVSPRTVAMMKNLRMSQEIVLEAHSLQENIHEPSSAKTESMTGDMFHTTLLPTPRAEAARTLPPVHPSSLCTETPPGEGDVQEEQGSCSPPAVKSSTQTPHAAVQHVMEPSAKQEARSLGRASMSNSGELNKKAALPACPEDPSEHCDLPELAAGNGAFIDQAHAADAAGDNRASLKTESGWEITINTHLEEEDAGKPTVTNREPPNNTTEPAQPLHSSDTNAQGSSSSAFAPSAMAFMSTLDALAVSTQRMNNASTMEENLASSPKEARFPVHMSSPVGSYTAGTLEMHKVLSGSQLAEDAISVEQDASERHKGASEALAGTIGVICPCCGVLASDPSSIFTTDVSGTRQHFCLKDLRVRGIASSKAAPRKIRPSIRRQMSVSSPTRSRELLKAELEAGALDSQMSPSASMSTIARASPRGLSPSMSKASLDQALHPSASQLELLASPPQRAKVLLQSNASSYEALYPTPRHNMPDDQGQATKQTECGTMYCYAPVTAESSSTWIIQHISAMSEYCNKSPEEIRYEDYTNGQQGVEGATLFPAARCVEGLQQTQPEDGHLTGVFCPACGPLSTIAAEPHQRNYAVEATAAPSKLDTASITTGGSLCSSMTPLCVKTIATTTAGSTTEGLSPEGLSPKGLSPLTPAAAAAHAGTPSKKPKKNKPKPKPRSQRARKSAALPTSTSLPAPVLTSQAASPKADEQPPQTPHAPLTPFSVRNPDTEESTAVKDLDQETTAAAAAAAAATEDASEVPIEQSPPTAELSSSALRSSPDNDDSNKDSHSPETAQDAMQLVSGTDGIDSIDCSPAEPVAHVASAMHSQLQPSSIQPAAEPAAETQQDTTQDSDVKVAAEVTTDDSPDSEMPAESPEAEITTDAQTADKGDVVADTSPQQVDVDDGQPTAPLEDTPAEGTETSAVLDAPLTDAEKISLSAAEPAVTQEIEQAAVKVSDAVQMTVSSAGALESMSSLNSASGSLLQQGSGRFETTVHKPGKKSKAKPLPRSAAARRARAATVGLRNSTSELSSGAAAAAVSITEPTNGA